MQLYSIYKIKKWDVVGLLKISDILYKCGKDMAKRYSLHHWNNSRLKTWVIVFLCLLKNNIYLVCEKNILVATFQTRKIDDSFLFQKLATLPEYAGGGIGSFCLNEIERLAKTEGCEAIICEVYDKSEHAKRFYENRGYHTYGVVNTIKYKEIKLKKEI